MAHEGDKQVNFWIPEALRNHLARRAEEEKRTMTDIVIDLIREDIARHDGELLQNQTLVVLQEMVAAELRQANAQLRRDLREDREHEAESLFERLKKQFDRVAGLTVVSVRNGGIARRMIYSAISKAFDPSFAKAVYDHARQKAQEELLPKKAPTVHTHIEDDEQ